MFKNWNFETFLLAVFAAFIGVPALLNGLWTAFIGLAQSIADNGGNLILYAVLFFLGSVFLLVIFAFVSNLQHAHAMKRIEQNKAIAFIEPDVNGRLPIAQAAMYSPEVIAQILEAHKASYTPNLSHYHHQPHYNGGAPGQSIVDATPVKPPLQPDNFWKLYQSGELPKESFLLGYNLDEDGAEITATWKDLYSALVGGKSGMGKSTLVRLILAQSALQGGRFVIIDPHYNSGEESLGASLQPLSHLMLCDVACTEDEITKALAFVGDIGRKRLHGQDLDRWPLILVVDETTALFKRSSVAADLLRTLGSIAEETRKVGVFALCIGQNFNGQIMDTTVRNSFVSMLSCRTRKDVARVQTGSNEFGEMAGSLEIGQAVWMTPRGELYRLAVPNCTQADLELVAERVRTPKNGQKHTQPGQNFGATPVDTATNTAYAPTNIAAYETTNSPLSNTYHERHFSGRRSGGSVGSNGGSDLLTATEAVERQERKDLADRAIAMFLDGSSPTAIVKVLWGEPKGAKEQVALAEFSTILREYVLSLDYVDWSEAPDDTESIAVQLFCEGRSLREVIAECYPGLTNVKAGRAVSDAIRKHIRSYL